MVITFISGGLGNQMFQYAAGQALAERLGATHRLDLADYRLGWAKRPFELGWLCATAKEASLHEKWLVSRLTRPRIATASGPLKKLGLPVEANYVFDSQQGYTPYLTTLKGHVYLKGAWESERYFAPAADVIRREFAFRSEPNEVNRAMLDQIQSTESVALHVRRGDKATLTKPDHGVCGVDYYERAVEKIQERISNPHFFMFSDEPDWTKENIKVKFPATYVYHNTGSQSPEDLRLMSHCKHFIIAGSTFSWWGAWLGQNPNKFIVAPQKWFHGPDVCMLDRIPEGWVQV